MLPGPLPVHVLYDQKGLFTHLKISLAIKNNHPWLVPKGQKIIAF